MTRRSVLAHAARLMLLLGLASGASMARAQAGPVATPTRDGTPTTSPTRDATPTAPPATRPAPARPAEDDVDAELRKLEAETEAAEKTAKDKGSGSMLQRFIQTTNPDLSAILMLTGAYFYDHALRGKGNVSPLGATDPTRSGFQLQELELALQAAVDPYFRMDLFLAIDAEGIEVEEGFLTSLGLPWGLQVRLGILRQRFGRFNQTHLHTWSFVDAPVVAVRFLGGDGLRGAAGEVSWLMPVKWYSALTVTLANATGEGAASFVGEGVRDEAFHVRDPRHLQYTFRWDQFYELSSDWGMSLGLSYALGPNASGGRSENLTHLFGGDLFIKYRPLRRQFLAVNLTVEGIARLMQVPGDRLVDWGIYAQIDARLANRWWLALRYDHASIDDSAQLVAFGFAEPGESARYPVAVDDQHRGSVALSFLPTHFSALRLQYNSNWTRRLDEAGRPTRFRPSHEVLVQVGGNIGSHGAHAY